VYTLLKDDDMTEIPGVEPTSPVVVTAAAGGVVPAACVVVTAEFVDVVTFSFDVIATGVVTGVVCPMFVVTDFCVVDTAACVVVIAEFVGEATLTFEVVATGVVVTGVGVVVCAEIAVLAAFLVEVVCAGTQTRGRGEQSNTTIFLP